MNLRDPAQWNAEIEGGGEVQTRGVGDALEVQTTAAPRRHLVHR